MGIQLCSNELHIYKVLDENNRKSIPFGIDFQSVRKIPISILLKLPVIAFYIARTAA